MDDAADSVLQPMNASLFPSGDICGGHSSEVSQHSGGGITEAINGGSGVGACCVIRRREVTATAARVIINSAPRGNFPAFSAARPPHFAHRSRLSTLVSLARSLALANAHRHVLLGISLLRDPVLTAEYLLR